MLRLPNYTRASAASGSLLGVEHARHAVRATDSRLLTPDSCAESALGRWRLRLRLEPLIECCPCHVMCEIRQGGEARMIGFLAGAHGVQDAFFSPLRLGKRRMGRHAE
jgi:hypothetical protein